MIILNFYFLKQNLQKQVNSQLELLGALSSWMALPCDCCPCEKCLVPLVVGIAGATRSGKSTLAKALKTHYENTAIIQMDRYFDVPFKLQGFIIRLDRSNPLCTSKSRK